MYTCLCLVVVAADTDMHSRVCFQAICDRHSSLPSLSVCLSPVKCKTLDLYDGIVYLLASTSANTLDTMSREAAVADGKKEQQTRK